jgi:hypothetical protein
MRDRDRYPYIDRILFFLLFFVHSLHAFGNKKNYQDKGVEAPEKGLLCFFLFHFRISVTMLA